MFSPAMKQGNMKMFAISFLLLASKNKKICIFICVFNVYVCDLCVPVVCDMSSKLLQAPCVLSEMNVVAFFSVVDSYIHEKTGNLSVL